MKQLLRKRTTSTSSPSTSTSHSQPSVSVSVSAPAPLAPAPASPAAPSTPLYARFATTHRGQDKPVVSGPIALAPRRGGQAPPEFNVSAPGPVARGPSGRKEGDERRVALRKEEVGREDRAVERPAEREVRDRERQREKETRGEKEREVKRMPSGGEALEGRTGGRAEGERVLLPARKVAGKRAEGRGEDAGGDGRTMREVAEERRKRDISPQKRVGLDEPSGSPGERVLLPARKITRTRAEEIGTELREGRLRGTGSREASPVKESDAERSIGWAEAPRVEGERVLLPARKVARKKAEVERDGEQSSAVGRRTREAHEAPSLVSFPSSSSTHPGSASTRAVVINPSSNSEGWEDKFSTPKRLHVKASSSSTPAELLRLPLELSHPPDPSTKTHKSTANSSTVSSATASTQPSSSSSSTPRDSDDRQRVVGDRVLLPARKLAHRRAESTSESVCPSERGRTLSTKRHARLSRDVGSDVSAATSSVPFAGSAASDASRAGADRTVYDDLEPRPGRALDSATSAAPPDSSSATQRTGTTSNEGSSAIDAKSTSASAAAQSSLEHANPSDGLTKTKASLSQPVNGVPSGSKPAAWQASTSGRPPRRRKYSLLAAFGLPSTRTASDSETSSGPITQNTKPPTTTSSSSSAAAPSAPPPSSLAPTVADTLVTPPVPPTSPSAESGAEPAREPRQRLPSSARRALPELQLQSLHLSGFNFPLDTLLGDGQDTTHDMHARMHDIPPVPPIPAPSAPPASTQPPPSPNVSKRRTVLVDSPPALASPSDPPAPASRKPSSARSSPPSAPGSSNQHPPQNSPPSAPSTTTSPAAADPPVRQAPPPVQAQKVKAAKPTTRGLDFDHSLLSPESDTRYPIPRRSPTGQSSRSRTHKQSTSPPENESPHRASPPRSLPPKQEQSSMFPDASQRGPVQGRPLIFAAMAAAEVEAEISQPTAWMAVPTGEEHALEGDGTPAQTEHSNGSSHFVNGYPTPRSTSPKLPTAASPDIKHQPETKSAAAAMGRNFSEPAAAERPGTDNRDHGRRPSPSSPYSQSPPTHTGNLPTPPEMHPPRLRKLSKSRSRVTRMMDGSHHGSPLQAQPQPQTQPDSDRHHARSTLGAKPPTPVEDAPPLRTREGPSRTVPKSTHASSNGAVPAAPSTAILGSPFQTRTEKAAVDRQRSESSRSPPSRVISSESAVPTRPVKVLTERQMEKLSATKGVPVNASNGVHGSQRRHEHPVPIRSPPLRTKQLSSPQTPPEEPIVIQASSSGSTNGAPPPPPTTPPKRHTEDLAASTPPKAADPERPRDPDSPEDYAQARSRRRGKALEKERPEGIENVVAAADPEPEDLKEPTYYPLEKHVAEPALFGTLLGYLSFGDWLALSSVCKLIRTTLYEDRELTERVLERYLRVVGYGRWAFPESEPLALTLTDLNAYMHGISIPAHQYSRFAETYLQLKGRREWEWTRTLAAACRSFTRVVLRLRAQAEAEARAASAVARDRARSPGSGWGGSTTSVNHIPQGMQKRSFSRGSSRAPSPTSMFSRSHHGHPGHSRNGSQAGQALHHSQSVAQFHGPGQGNGTGTFQSPLFRLRRAPLLQVFVPSPEGEWLSDASVLECEQELKRAGVLHLLRPGDVVWDTAVGDEGNMGRLMWDGSYLIDLDYTYSRSGDLPKYLPTLAFPPSYFHRVIRTMGSGNPICHIDISPWGEEVATNLQLLQDRMKTETPQGGHHVVVRWVHRSSFTVRPPPSGKPLRISVPKSIGPGPGPGGTWFVDPGWYGTVVVEAEGTNEGLADLQERCRGAFPIRAIGANPSLSVSPEREARMEERRSVFRIMRERSRPGEIWIKTVTEKERLLPP